MIFQTRWELQGLDRVMEPSDFTLGVKGALYPDRRGRQTRLKGRLETSISFVLPSVLALVPEDVRRNMANAVRNCFIYAIGNSKCYVPDLYMIYVFDWPFTDFGRFGGEHEAQGY